MTHPTLRKGDTGRPVLSLQLALLAHGAEPHLDGVFDASTASMVAHFQSRNGLDATGIAGPETWHALVGRPELRPFRA